MVPPIPRDDTVFVLLDDARAAGAAPARLYVNPVQVVVTRRADEVEVALEALRTATRGGLYAAGFITYEAGHALEPKLAEPAQGALPLLWFGLFRDYREIAADGVAALLPDPAGAWLGAPVPAIERAEYDAALARVHELIAAGDIYQANLTFPANVATAGHPLSLYASMRSRARAGYGGVIHTGRDWILSLSPELFFSLDGRRIVTRPMKGTAARLSDPSADAVAAATLSTDEKQRAENLMIVDLLRNDLSRVAEAGSVAVPDLFRVESFPTVHQMTSTVTADLAQERDAVDVLATIFPCGSITGAPKIRAMEVIAEVEGGPRGAYTGSIGRIDAGGDVAAFNVAIRTLHLNEDRQGATMGLGSGIVADSNAADEWAECLAKGAFVASTRKFDLIETMGFDPHKGIARLEGHLTRMRDSAAALGFAFDRHAARNELQAATFRLREPRRIRLMLAPSGAMAIASGAMPEVPGGPVDVAIVPLPVDRDDFRLVHKTTDRRFYDAARTAFEAIFTDPDGYLTEGSFTDIFVPKGDIFLTPPLSRRLLPGVLRAELIESGRARERDLRPEDLASGFFIGNSLRGLLPARVSQL